MNERIKVMLLVLGAALLIAGGSWTWFQLMEKRWQAEVRIPDAVLENRMHAALLLLRQRGHSVTMAGSLGEMSLDSLPDGTLLLGDGSGVVAPDKAAKLLAWVRRGNTLVAHPRMIDGPERKLMLPSAATADDASAGAESAVPAPASACRAPADGKAAPAAEQEAGADEGEEEEEAEEQEDADEDQDVPLTKLVEVDPIAAHLGVRVFYPGRPKCSDAEEPEDGAAPAAKAEPKCKEPAPRRLMMPGAGHWLEVDERYAVLVGLRGAPAPVWSDADGTTVRAYAEGKGRIVMLTSNFFDYYDLQDKDHAELLLALTALNGASKNVTIVRHLDVLPWYEALWEHYRLALLSAAALLLLLLWAAVRRFGPLLPAPAHERRSLMEHIDASGAWLWKAEGGRQLLLEAARAETMAVVGRRAPGLLRLPEAELAAALARLCGLSQQHVSEALQQEASPQPLQFTRQIRTLQTLRNHHER